MVTSWHYGNTKLLDWKQHYVEVQSDHSPSILIVYDSLETSNHSITIQISEDVHVGS